MKGKLMSMLAIVLAIAGIGRIEQAYVPAKAPRRDLIVGVFREDGVILPFARYADGKWANPWHSARPVDQPDEPDTIADLSTPWYDSFVNRSGKWYLWPSAGQMRTLNTSKNVVVCSHCQHVWGLLSDYPKPKQPEKNARVQNVGVAISENKRAWSMNRLTSASPHWKQLLTLLVPAFERAENRALAEELNRQYARQLPPARQRAKTRLSILSLRGRQLPPEGRVLLYFAVSKEYRNFYISLFSGWALQDTHGKLTLVDSQFAPTDLDMKEGDMTEPFLILPLDGKTFAIVAEYGYEGESYTILEIRKDRVHRVLETLAGAC